MTESRISPTGYGKDGYQSGFQSSQERIDLLFDLFVILLGDLLHDVVRSACLKADRQHSGTGTGKQTGTRGRVLKTFAFCDTPADFENFFMNIRMFDKTGSHLQTLVNVQAAAKSQVHTAGKTGNRKSFR